MKWWLSGVSINQSINQQAVVRGTTNPAPVLPPSERPTTAISLHSQSLGGSTNKLTFDQPTRLPELAQNLIRSSHGHSTPCLEIACKSVWPFPRNLADKEISIAASRGLPELTQNVIRSSHAQSTASLKISRKSVQQFSRNHADKETNKERNKERKKEIELKQYPIPLPGAG